MSAGNWKSDYTNIAEITAELERRKNVKPEGEVSFTGAGYRTLVAVLVSAFGWNPDVPDSDRRGIMRRTIADSGRQGEITPISLKDNLLRQQSNYLKNPFQRYVMITSMSTNRSTKLRRRRIENATIIFEPQLPRRFQKQLAEFYDIFEVRKYPQIPNDYVLIRIHAKGRSVSDAASRAFKSIDLLRGIWNLALNIGQSWRWSSGPIRKPVNRLILGPLHTLHLPNGKMASQMWWYEPDRQIPIEVFDTKKYLERMYSFEDWVRKRLKNVPYRAEIINAIINYSRALDQRDWGATFLQLWSVLEDVTFTGKDSYKTTIRRAAYIWKENDFHYQVLLHLRDLRNSFVHENVTDDDMETHMYDLKEYVEHLIIFHLRNANKFANTWEVRQFLDLPRRVEEIDRQISLYSMAKRYRSGRSL